MVVGFVQLNGVPGGEGVEKIATDRVGSMARGEGDILVLVNSDEILVEAVSHY